MSLRVFTVTVEAPTTEDLLRKHNLEKGGLVQQVIDQSVIDFSVAYCPFDTGTLAYSPYVNTVIGSGVVTYPGPYAHYLYHGIVYGPNIPVFEDDSGVPTRWFSPPGQKKHPTGAQLTYKTDYNPLAGPFWVDRMKADRINDILEVAKHAAGVK